LFNLKKINQVMTLINDAVGEQLTTILSNSATLSLKPCHNVTFKNLIDSVLHEHLFLCTYAANRCTASQFETELAEFLRKSEQKAALDSNLTDYSVYQTWLGVLDKALKKMVQHLNFHKK